MKKTKYAMNMMINRETRERFIVAREIVKEFKDEGVALTINDDATKAKERFMLIDIMTGIFICYTCKSSAGAQLANLMPRIREVRAQDYYEIWKEQFIDMSASCDLRALIDDCIKRKEAKNGRNVSEHVAGESENAEGAE